MGRKLKPSETSDNIEAHLLQGLALSERAGLYLTAAYIAMAFDALATEAAARAVMTSEKPSTMAPLEPQRHAAPPT